MLAHMRTPTVLLAAIAVAAFVPACGDRPTSSPAEAATDVDNVAEALRIHLKLPLEQTEFHWVFTDKQKLLDGELRISIRSNDDETTVITPFHDGVLSEDWAFLDFSQKLPADQAYFGLKSNTRFKIAADDEVTLQLTVLQDLEGQGPDATGVLKAGTYSATGRFTLFPPAADPERVAFVGDKPVEGVSDPATAWKETWPLVITSHRGWMTDPSAPPTDAGGKQTTK